MNQRHYLLKGTFLLTVTGLITRTAGFFYKIFLSRTIGAVEIGLFQMTVPVFSFCMSLACGGIQTAISRYTAEHFARGKQAAAIKTLLCGILISGSTAVLCTAVLYQNADFIAARFLLEEKCSDLLRITSLSLPFCIIHCCINGYFIGRKNILPSALSQFIEQAIRICSVFIFYAVLTEAGRKMNAAAMALGQLAGELAAAMYCVYYFLISENNTASSSGENSSTIARNILSVSLPLGLNRILLCIIQWIEAALLPRQLQLSGLESSAALSIYGTLTGMALPVIFFPTAITGALGSLLLPAMSEARTLKRGSQISETVSSTIQAGLMLGLFCLSAFLLFGRTIGNVLFRSSLAGQYICKLALTCPFLYMNTTLTSVLHGLDKTTAVFLINMSSFLIRLASVVLFVPDAGIDGYLCGLILSQLFSTACILLLLHSIHCLSFNLNQWKQLIAMLKKKFFQPSA